MSSKELSQDNFFRNAFLSVMGLSAIVVLAIALFYPSDSKPMLWRDGEIKGATGGPEYRFITKVLVPTLQGERFWRNQHEFYSLKVEELKKKGPPDTRVLEQKEVQKFQEAVKEIELRLNFVARDEELQKDQVRYAEILEAIASKIPKLEKALVQNINEIYGLPAKHIKEIEDYEKLIEIIEEKMNK